MACSSSALIGSMWVTYCPADSQLSMLSYTYCSLKNSSGTRQEKYLQGKLAQSLHATAGGQPAYTFSADCYCLAVASSFSMGGSMMSGRPLLGCSQLFVKFLQVSAMLATFFGHRFCKTFRASPSDNPANTGISSGDQRPAAYAYWPTSPWPLRNTIPSSSGAFSLAF